jgi:hypothetical protein
MKRTFPVVVLGALALFLCCLCVDASAAVITGRLSNFDLKNVSGSQATDLDMIISGISCSDISYYFGQYSGLMNMSCANVGGGKIRVTFSGGTTFPVPNGQWRHFGLQFSTANTPNVEKIFWTSGGVQTGNYIDFVGLSWTGSVDCPVHMEESRADSLGASPYVQVRDANWATAPHIISLDSMVRGNPAMTALQWMPEASLNGTLTTASDVLSFWTPPLIPGGDPAVLARYVVLGAGGDTLGYYFEQVSIVGKDVPAMSHWAVLVALVCVLAVVTVALLRRRVAVSASRS